MPGASGLESIEAGLESYSNPASKNPRIMPLAEKRLNLAH